MPRGGGRGGGDLLLRVDPLDVLFSYGRVAPAFSGCGRTLQATLASLLAGELAPDDLPHIAVVPIPPELWTRVGKSHAGGAARNDPRQKAKNRRMSTNRFSELMSEQGGARDDSGDAEVKSEGSDVHEHLIMSDSGTRPSRHQRKHVRAKKVARELRN